jgi:hypothetical protein
MPTLSSENFASLYARLSGRAIFFVQRCVAAFQFVLHSREEQVAPRRYQKAATPGSRNDQRTHLVV